MEIAIVPTTGTEFMGSQKSQPNLGKKIRMLRKNLGWSMQELADRCGVKLTYIQDIEYSRNKNPEHLPMIAKVLGTTASALRYDEEGYDVEQVKGWVAFLTDLAFAYEKRAGVPLGQDFHTEVLQTGLELGLGNPVPATDKEKNAFINQFESVFRK